MSSCPTHTPTRARTSGTPDDRALRHSYTSRCPRDTPSRARTSGTLTVRRTQPRDTSSPPTHTPTHARTSGIPSGQALRQTNTSLPPKAAPPRVRSSGTPLRTPEEVPQPRTRRPASPQHFPSLTSPVPLFPHLLHAVLVTWLSARSSL